MQLIENLELCHYLGLLLFLEGKGHNQVFTRNHVKFNPVKKWKEKIWEADVIKGLENLRNELKRPKQETKDGEKTSKSVKHYTKPPKDWITETPQKD